MRATAAPFEGNRVRLSVEVDETEVAAAVDATARRLSRQVRVPGFRPGKVPRPVLEARLGGAQRAAPASPHRRPPRSVRARGGRHRARPDRTAGDRHHSGEDDGPVTFDVVVRGPPDGVRRRLSGPRRDRPGARGHRRGGRRPARPPARTVRRAVGRATGGADRRLRDHRPARHAPRRRGPATSRTTCTRWGRASDVRWTRRPAAWGQAGRHPRVHRPGARRRGRAGRGPGALSSCKDVKEKVLPEPTDEWASEASEFDTVEASAPGPARSGSGRSSSSRPSWHCVSGPSRRSSGSWPDEPARRRWWTTKCASGLHDLGHRLEERHLTCRAVPPGGRPRPGQPARRAPRRNCVTVGAPGPRRCGHWPTPRRSRSPTRSSTRQ